MAWREAVAEYRSARHHMVATQLAARGIRDERVLDALRTVPRHRFVAEPLHQLAYEDIPLPIVGDQTISQPYMVAFMSEVAAIERGDRCLEIGTGSGYQAAILAELGEQTFSIEYLPEVAAFGRGNVEALGYLDRGVFLRVGDGYAGWLDQAPFDAIIVTAAPELVPAPLLNQLAVGGRLVVPVGDASRQTLEVWTRRRLGNDPGAFVRDELFSVHFVPFLRPRADHRN
jgi:protein-L-isoaspartate(D-aspartate) O-methyltransferase